MGHLLAATNSGPGAGLLLIYIVFYVLFALGAWGAYKKASPQGDPAWAAFVPIYNFIVLLKIAGRPVTWAWFLLLVFIPIVGSLALLVVSIIVLNDVSKSFGHGGGFTVGLVLLAPIFWYILWLGPSTYRGPAGPAGMGGGYGGGYGGGGSSYGQYPSQGGYPTSGGYGAPSQPGSGLPPPPPGQMPPPPVAPPPGAPPGPMPPLQ
jgi:Family of unknown function (DUF5684)